MATFDGPNLTITLAAGTPIQNGIRVYSEWKEWVRQSDNAKFLPAFGESVGGNLTNPPESIAAYVFVRNDLGWRIRPPEETGEILLTGDLFPFDPNTAMFIPTIGTFNAFVRQLVSSKALQTEVGTSGLTAQESAALLLSTELQEADHWFDKTNGLLHYYRRGTTVDIIPPKQVVGETAPTDVRIDQP